MTQPLQLFGDFGFVGGEDNAPDTRQNAQICINWYPELNNQNPKEALSLLGCPGLVELVAAPGGGAPGFSDTQTVWPQPYSGPYLPVRGAWVLPGGQTALVVISDACYLVQATSATYNSFPTLTLTQVGTLLSTTGSVSIADDNGVGFGVGSFQVGYAILVDGHNGYTYNYLTNTFAVIDDVDFPGADKVMMIDGWFVFNQPGTQSFYTPNAPYSVIFGNAYFALKDGAPDNLMSIAAHKELLWLMGERTTEIWYNAGGQYFPFQRLSSGAMIQYGCHATHSVARVGSGGEESLIWFGRSERGDNQILRSKGFSVDCVSSPAFSKEVSQYPITSDAIAYSYQEDTHEFYVLTFPTADSTWVYDTQTTLLHKRLSYDPYITTVTNTINPPGFHRHRSNCFLNFQGMRIVGDYQNGALYQLTRNAHTDAGWPLLAKRRSPHVWDGGQRGRVFMGSLQLDFYPGVGNASGMGANPQARLSISRDAGQTFGQQFLAPMGQIGQTRNRTMFRKLGWARDSVFDLEVIDPVPRDLVGCTLKAFSAA